MRKEMTCAFTGHRLAKLPWGEDESDPRCMALKKEIYDAAEVVYTSGIRHYICGMANGCDMYFCEEIIRLRQRFPEVTLEAAIPYLGQALRWSPGLRRRYEQLLCECDIQTIVSQNYTRDCMMRRNCYMVDAASHLIAAYDGTAGGTQNTMLYALRQGLEIITLSIPEQKTRPQGAN